MLANRPPGPREFDVLHLLRRGSSNLEIGRALGITERTVKAHVMGIMEKLDAPDRAGAVAKGFDLGILKAVMGGQTARSD
jgi:DNA-binding NarL/FixJ family response regulator